jgi:hypothetical protein
MTEITNLQVHEPGFISLTLNSPNAAYQVRLDGWNQWRPVSEFSWYPPHLVVGSQDAPLREGLRTIQVTDDAGATFDSEEFRVGPEAPPEPQPPFDLPQIFAPTKPSDWTNLLKEGYQGELSVTIDGTHRAYIAPNQQVRGGRMEFHELDWPGGGLPVPSEGYYEWDSLILPGSVIDGLGTSQLHGDNRSGFTGSIGIMFVNGTPQYRLRIMDAGNPTPRPFGVLKPDTYQKVGMHVRWSKGTDGFVRCYLDGNLGCEFKGKTAADAAGKQMFRIGWYTSDRVGAAGLDLRAKNIKVYGRAG